MHNLISTVECIYRVARGIKIDLTVSDEQYEHNVEVSLSDKEYSIPSLIWPPPTTDTAIHQQEVK